MIKINLANKRRLSSASQNKGSIFSNIFGGKAIDSSQLKDLDLKRSPLVRVLIAVFLVYVVQIQIEALKQEQIQEIDQKISAVSKEQEEVSKKLARVKGFEPVKKQLDSDEKTIQTKLAVLQSLTEDRDIPAKLMKQISQIIPEEVWLTSLSVREGKVQLQGGASSYNMVSDFMNGLGVSSLLSEVSLAQISETQKDGIKTHQFDISAKRKGGTPK